METWLVCCVKDKGMEREVEEKWKVRKEEGREGSVEQERGVKRGKLGGVIEGQRGSGRGEAMEVCMDERFSGWMVDCRVVIWDGGGKACWLDNGYGDG